MTDATVTPAFWAGKRVFLTGHTGFKGGWLALWLADMGAEVHGYALAPDQTPNLFTVADVAAALASHVIADIRDGPALTRAIAVAAPDVVLHLAAQPLVFRGYDAPVETFEVNVMGTARLLEACRALPAGTPIVIVSSDKCYENAGAPRDFTETDPMGGDDPYSASKGATELVTHAFRASFFHGDDRARVASARAGNVIGGGDWSEKRLLPDCARAFSRGARVFVRNPAATRPWQHVLEPLSGYLILAEALARDPAFASGWNFGPADAGGLPVRTVIDHAVAAWGEGAGYDTHPAFRQGWAEAKTLGLDCAAARERLRWRPALDVAAAVEMTMAWYKAAHGHATPAEMRRLTLTQIAAYMAAGARS